MPDSVRLLLLTTVFFQMATNGRIFQPTLYHAVSHKRARDTEQSNRNRAALPDFERALETTQHTFFQEVKRPYRRDDHKLDTELS
jgi:hypothetical protein